MTNMLEMETYLQENCADLDYTAVKMPTGTKQQESGIYPDCVVRHVARRPIFEASKVLNNWRAARQLFKTLLASKTSSLRPQLVLVNADYISKYTDIFVDKM